MALDYIEIKDAGNVNRKIVGKFNGNTEFQQGVHLLGPSRSDTHTGAGNGTTVTVADIPCGHFALQVVETGGVTAWSVVLEVSLDGTNFRTILSHTEADGDKAILFSGPNKYPALYFRSRCISRTGGTSVAAYIVGLP